MKHTHERYIHSLELHEEIQSYACIKNEKARDSMLGISPESSAEWHEENERREDVAFNISQARKAAAELQHISNKPEAVTNAIEQLKAYAVMMEVQEDFGIELDFSWMLNSSFFKPKQELQRFFVTFTQSVKGEWLLTFLTKGEISENELSVLDCFDSVIQDDCSRSYGKGNGKDVYDAMIAEFGGENNG